MSATFFDRQNAKNAENGSELLDGPAAEKLIRRHTSNPPFFAEFVSHNKAKLLVGLGAEIGCAQFSASSDAPPYLVAALESEKMRSGFASFSIDGTPSEVPLRLCVPLSVLQKVVAYFVETGQRSPSVQWEEI